MHVQTRLQTRQHKVTLSSTSENMVEEADNRHVIDEVDQLIEKALALQGTKIFS